jgi:hypothetical protein
MSKLKALLLVAAALGFPWTIPGPPDAGVPSVMERIERLRVQLRDSAASGDAVDASRASGGTKIAQWGNWGNWANWNNWANWGNWRNL